MIVHRIIDSVQWSDFQAKNNSELLNNLGNFVNRALSFVVKFYGSKVPAAQINGPMRAWAAEVNELLHEYEDCMEKNNQRDGLRTILSISKLGNKLIQVWQPWVKVKSKVSFCQGRWPLPIELNGSKYSYVT